mgnify:CR=1 FL=1
MATPSTFTPDMLKQMADAIRDAPRSDFARSILMPKGMQRALVAQSEQLKGVPIDHNPLREGFDQRSFLGYDVIVADVPPQIRYDWSGCRSPSRAKRRHARGIPQRVKVVRDEVAYLIDRRMAELCRQVNSELLRNVYGLKDWP